MDTLIAMRLLLDWNVVRSGALAGGIAAGAAKGIGRAGGICNARIHPRGLSPLFVPITRPSPCHRFLKLVDCSRLMMPAMQKRAYFR
jgi:hypothetical protein